ncbi:MAG TPA: 30S ribosomal protein S4 [Candidatus Acidoferrales bacterium]|nr:30S ribosomal protein S4 [Candidatus Acidoferrales bacterium]
MGSAKRNRKKFEKPKERWNLARIKGDNTLVEEYGLKNMKELWKVQTEISRIRGNVRKLLSGGSHFEDVKERLIGRLVKLGIATNTTTLDDLLDLKERSLLDRRLQSVVFKKGMARTVKQARQLTVHGFIAIDGKKVDRPSYLVDASLESRITYRRPIDIMAQKVEKPAEAKGEEAPVAEAAAQEAPATEQAETNTSE